MSKQNKIDDPTDKLIELTQVDFWDDYWVNCKLPSTVDYSFSFERCLAQILKQKLKPQNIHGDVLEIGCAPGKWLAFMAKEFNLKVHGIEYSKAGMEITKKNFQILGLETGVIHTADFFQLEPDQMFDVVMSFGFIEHFVDVDLVVERHIKWLKPGGILILGVPNFRGLNKILQKILNNDIIEKHNLDIMNLNYFKKLEKKFNLAEISISYLGSFEPSLLIGDKGPNSKLKLVVNTIIFFAKKIRKLKFFDNINSRFFSSYILSIYKKC